MVFITSVNIILIGDGSDFKNPDDPTDTSFELKVHEDGKEYPFEALEFPNNDAYDRYTDFGVNPD